MFPLMPEGLFKTWLLEEAPSPTPPVRLFREREGPHAQILDLLVALLADHYVGAAIVAKMGGYEKAAAVIRNSLPTSKQTRSGDFGEIVATEFVEAETTFRVPVRKLRWKSDRQMPMHGDDLIAVDATKDPVQVLKGESKSGATIGKKVVSDAAEQLDAHNGRPNPSTLAFITKRLYEEGRDAEAKVFQDLQCDGGMTPKNLTHAIIVVAGTNPCAALAQAPPPAEAGISREVAAIVIRDHAAFVEALFDSAYGARP